MTHPIEDNVKQALTDYHRRIHSVINRAWGEWQEVEEFRRSRRFGPVLYPRTVANYVFDAIARIATAEFSSDVRCRVLTEPQTIKICFDDQVIGRFKKGSADNLGRNNRTQAVMDFIDPQKTLPHLPAEADKVEFIWAANDIGTALDRVLVVARHVDNLIWSYEINDAEAAGATIPLPLDRTGDSGASAGDSIVTPKRPADEESGNEE